MRITPQEKKFLKELLKKHLKDFEKNEKVSLRYSSPRLISAEIQYDMFLKGLIKKIK